MHGPLATAVLRNNFVNSGTSHFASSAAAATMAEEPSAAAAVADDARLAAEDYAASLRENLTRNDKVTMNMLTMLAEDYQKYAVDIVRVIEQHIQQVPAPLKLPALYLIDSIIKNCPKLNYIALFQRNIMKTFETVFRTGDEKVRQSMHRLRVTWVHFFSKAKLYGIDCAINKIDPAWPILDQVAPGSSAQNGVGASRTSSTVDGSPATTVSKTVPTVTAAPHTIHLNPKFLAQQKVALLNKASTSASNQAKEKLQKLQEEKERLQAEMVKKTQAVLPDSSTEPSSPKTRPQSVVTVPSDAKQSKKDSRKSSDDRTEVAASNVANKSPDKADKKSSDKADKKKKRESVASEDVDGSPKKSKKEKKPKAKSKTKEKLDGDALSKEKKEKRKERNYRKPSPEPSVVPPKTSHVDDISALLDVLAEAGKSNADQSPSVAPAQSPAERRRDVDLRQLTIPRKRTSDSTSNGDKAVDNGPSEKRLRGSDGSAPMEMDEDLRPATGGNRPRSDNRGRGIRRNDGGHQYHHRGGARGRYSRGGGGSFHQRGGGGGAGFPPRPSTQPFLNPPPPLLQQSTVLPTQPPPPTVLGAPETSARSSLLPTPPVVVRPMRPPVPYSEQAAAALAAPPPPGPAPDAIPANNRIFVDGIPYEVQYIDDTPAIERNGQPHRIYFTGPPRNVVIDGVAHSLAFGDKKTVMIDGNPHVIRFGAPSRELYMGAYPFRGAFGGPPIFATINGIRHEIRLGGPPPEVKIEPDPCYELIPKMPDAARRRARAYEQQQQPQPAPQLDLMALMAKLQNSGVLPTVPSIPSAPSIPANLAAETTAAGSGGQSPMRPPTPPIPSQYRVDDKQQLAPANLKEFSMRALKVRYESVINMLYSSKVRCPNCGLRFADLDQQKYANHLDWHFKENSRIQQGAGVGSGRSRDWYLDAEEWVECLEICEEDSTGGTQNTDKDRTAGEGGGVCVGGDSVIATSGIEMCATCGETFEQYYDDDDETWKLRNAVKIDGKVYHPVCFQDVSMSTLTNDEATAPVPFLLTNTSLPTSQLPGLDAVVEEEPPVPQLKEEAALGQQIATSDTPGWSARDPIVIKDEPEIEVKQEPTTDTAADSSCSDVSVVFTSSSCPSAVVDEGDVPPSTLRAVDSPGTPLRDEERDSSDA